MLIKFETSILFEILDVAWICWLLAWVLNVSRSIIVILYSARYWNVSPRCIYPLNKLDIFVNRGSFGNDDNFELFVIILEFVLCLKKLYKVANQISKRWCRAFENFRNEEIYIIKQDFVMKKLVVPILNYIS